MFFHNHVRLYLLLAAAFAVSSCANNKFKLSDRQLSQKLQNSSMDHTARINVNGKIYDGFNLSIVGDSLEWYDGPNQAGKRYTSENRKVDAVIIKHPHELWPIFFPMGGFLMGLGVGAEIEAASTIVDLANEKEPTFSWTTPLAVGAIGAGLGYLGAIVFDPGVQENAWILKINN